MNALRARYLLASLAIACASVVGFACLGEDVGAGFTPSADAAPEASAADAASDGAERGEASVEAGAADAGPDVGPPATGDVLSLLQFGAGGNQTSARPGTGRAVALDADGNVFVAGGFTGTGIALGPACSLVDAGALTAFVARFDASGTCTKVVSLGGKSAVALAVDSTSKDVVVTGFTENDLDVAQGTVTGRGGSFVLKLSNDLGTLRWGTRFGTDGVVGGPLALSISSKGKIAIGGAFTAPSNVEVDVPYDRGAGGSFKATPVAAYIPYLFQLDKNGVLLTSSHVFQPMADGQCGRTVITSAAFDANEDLYFALSVPFNVNAGDAGTGCKLSEQDPLTQDLPGGGGGSRPRFSLTTSGVVIGRYQTSTTGLWQNVTYTLPSAVRGYLAVDPFGRVIAAYSYENPQAQKLGDIPALIPASRNYDILVVSYEEDKVKGFIPKAFVLGSALGFDDARDVATDAWGNVIVGGSSSDNFEVGSATGIGFGGEAGSMAGVVFKCRPGLSSCAWARLTKGNSAANEAVWGVAVDAQGRTAALGLFNPPALTFGSKTVDAGGSFDTFLGILSP